MSEIMTKKQLESSEIQTGACRFCGQIYQFETDGNASEKKLDKWAEEKCDCYEAKVYQKMTQRANEARDNIQELFGEKYEAASGILALGVDLILENEATKVTIDTGKGEKLSVSVNTKGIIKTEISKTVKKSMEV